MECHQSERKKKRYHCSSNIDSHFDKTTIVLTTIVFLPLLYFYYYSDYILHVLLFYYIDTAEMGASGCSEPSGSVNTQQSNSIITVPLSTIMEPPSMKSHASVHGGKVGVTIKVKRLV